MRSLKHSIEDRGFTEEYASHFVKMITPILDRLDEADRLILESKIPTILEFGEEAWLPGSLSFAAEIQSRIIALDPSAAPQVDGNRPQ